MIQQESRLNVADNSCQRKLHPCFRRNGKRYASLGDVIVVTVKSAVPASEIKKGVVSKAVIVRAKEVRRADGSIFVLTIMPVCY